MSDVERYALEKCERVAHWDGQKHEDQSQPRSATHHRNHPTAASNGRRAKILETMYTTTLAPPAFHRRALSRSTGYGHVLDRLRALFADSAESMLSKAVAERAHTVTIVLAPLVAWSLWHAISWRSVAPSSMRETRVVHCVDPSMRKTRLLASKYSYLTAWRRRRETTGEKIPGDRRGTTRRDTSTGLLGPLWGARSGPR